MVTFWNETEDGGILTATFENPPMNYYTVEALDELGAMVARWRLSNARAIVLRGGGVDGKFVTHFSVEQILNGLTKQALIETGPALNEKLNAVLRGLTELPQPVIAALNGDAMGFGFELALAADIRVGQHGDYRYGLCEASLGIVATGGGTQRMARIVGLGRALDLVLRARLLRPEEALEERLVSACSDDAVRTAYEIAREIVGKPRHGIAMSKRSLHRGYDLPLAQALVIESDSGFRARVTDSSEEALREFVELPLEARRDWLEQVHEPRLG